MNFLERVEMYVGTSAFDPIEVFQLEAIPESAPGLDDGISLETLSRNKYKEAIGRFLREGIVDVVEKTLALNPDDLHLFCQNLLIRPMDEWRLEETKWSDYFVPLKDADGGYKIKNNHILWVSREFGAINVPCHEISPQKALRIQDPESIFYTGVDYRNPIYYKSSGKIYIYPETSGQEQGKASALVYDETINADKDAIKYFPHHLYHLVAMYAAIRALKIASSQKRREFEKFNTPTKVWQQLYGTTTSIPSIPIFPTDLPDFGDTNLVDYSFGTEAANMSSIFSNLWNRIHNEEDVELAQAEIGRFNSMVTEYQNQLGTLTASQQNLLTKFTSELSEFTAKWDTMIKIWTQKVQSYTTEMQLLKADIAELTAQYNQSFFPKSIEEDKDKQE